MSGEIAYNSIAVENAINLMSSTAKIVNEAINVFKQSSDYLDFKKVSISGIDGVQSSMINLHARITSEVLSLASDKSTFDAAEDANMSGDMAGLLALAGNVIGFIASFGTQEGGLGKPPETEEKTNPFLEALQKVKNQLLENITNGVAGNWQNVLTSVEYERKFYQYDENGNLVESTNSKSANVIEYYKGGELIFTETLYSYDPKKDEMAYGTLKNKNIVEHINPNSKVLVFDLGGSGANGLYSVDGPNANRITVNNAILYDGASFVYIDYNALGGEANIQKDEDGMWYLKNEEQIINAVAGIVEDGIQKIEAGGVYTQEDLYVAGVAHSFGGHGLFPLVETLEEDGVDVSKIYVIEAIATTGGQNPGECIVFSYEDVEQYMNEHGCESIEAATDALIEEQTKNANKKGKKRLFVVTDENGNVVREEGNIEGTRLNQGIHDVNNALEYADVAIITGTNTAEGISVGSQQTGVYFSATGKAEYIVYYGSTHGWVSRDSAEFIALDIMSNAAEK